MKKSIKIILCTMLFTVIFVLSLLSANAKTYTYLRGDADQDNKISVSDSTAIQKKVAKMSVNSFEKAAADCNGNDIVDITDATLIQSYLAKFENTYSIGEEFSVTYQTDKYELPFIPN